MARMGERIKNAQKYHGGKDTEWSTLSTSRGGDRCKGCGRRWDKMTARQLRDHAKCKDKDGCPETED